MRSVQRCDTASGGRPAGKSARRGFTLLEILLTVALIGLLAGVLVTAAVQLTDDGPATPEEVFWEAVTESRREALLTGREVRLRFQAKNKHYALVALGSAREQRFAFPPAETLAVEFLTAQKGGGAMLIRSQLVETQRVPFVTFYSDGTCTPFRVQIRTGGEPRVLAIDPWTCAPVLPATEVRG